MKPETININARYYLAPSKAEWAIRHRVGAFDVIDRALEYNHRPAVVFSNGTEKECGEWVLRNREEPKQHTVGPWFVHARNGNCGTFDIWNAPDATGGAMWIADAKPYGGNFPDVATGEANAHLIATAPKLLALLEQYHSAMPTKESGALIAEAKGWTIQE